MTVQHLFVVALLAAIPARADVVPTGVHATSARAEADAFAALEEKRDCDAARSFLIAHSLAPDGRLVVNAALALERHGARAQALELFESVRGTPAAVVADVDARIRAIEAAAARGRADVVCARVALAGPSDSAQSGDSADFADVAEGVDGSDEPSPLFPAGVAALAGGLVVAGSTAGTVAWLHFGVIGNATAAGAEREGAIAARNPVLFAGGSLAGALVVAGAVLVPLSLMQEMQ